MGESGSSTFRTEMQKKNVYTNQEYTHIELDEDFYSELDQLVFLLNNAKVIRTY